MAAPASVIMARLLASRTAGDELNEISCRFLAASGRCSGFHGGSGEQVLPLFNMRWWKMLRGIVLVEWVEVRGVFNLCCVRLLEYKVDYLQLFTFAVAQIR